MDDVVNRLARELADAIAEAVAENSKVEACRERARNAGFEMRVSLEAVVGFVARSPDARDKQTAQESEGQVPQSRALVPRQACEMTSNDRRFLRSLRIAADDGKVEEDARPS